jgi:TetR/AcrR family transcriptional repressor of nem operon
MFTQQREEDMAPRQLNRSKAKLLDAAMQLIRTKGYTATTIDDICAAAGVTKGSFFHHFKSKDELGVEATQQWETMTEAVFGDAPYRARPDPRDRVLGYVDFRASMLDWDVQTFTCLLGTMVQEVYTTHPELRAACDEHMSNHTAKLIADVEAAKRMYAPDAPWSAASLAYYIQTVLQGSFIFAKAKLSAEVAIDSLAHLRRHLEMLFPKSQS